MHIFKIRKFFELMMNWNKSFSNKSPLYKGIIIIFILNIALIFILQILFSGKGLGAAIFFAPITWTLFLPGGFIESVVIHLILTLIINSLVVGSLLGLIIWGNSKQRKKAIIISILIVIFSISVAVINSYYYQKSANFVYNELSKGEYEGRDQTLDFCQNLRWSNLKSSCFLWLAIYEKDSSICELSKIDEGRWVEFCTESVELNLNETNR